MVKKNVSKKNDYFMNKNNLLASIALFGELYTNDKKENLSDILFDFIKGAVSFKERYTLNSTELKDLLSDVYGFSIPESVIRTTVKNRLKNGVTFNNGVYSFDIKTCLDKKNTISEINNINQKQEEIIKRLFEYIKTRDTNSSLTEEKVWEKLRDFIIDSEYSDEYSALISAFIINNNKELNPILNSIKKGLVLYNGLCFSNDISQSGKWNDELTIYLSTEHLFNCMGYNGILFKEVFSDFFSLVREINLSEKKQPRNGIIHLKYLEETKDEIDKFFQAAESIKKGTCIPDLSRPAMMEIINSCKNINDIKLKQARFYADLKTKNIYLKEQSYNTINQDYNIQSLGVIEELKSISNKKNKSFDEDTSLQYLQMFSKINYFRRGFSNLPFEKVRHIYMTENRFALFIAYNINKNTNEYCVPLAKDIDYIITKFWFKLKKGFNNNVLPKNFDVVARAQIVMASRISDSLADYYDKLRDELKEGKLTEEEAIELYALYTNKTLFPEEINSSNIEDTLSFINDKNYTENYLRENSRKEASFNKMQEKLEETERELNVYKLREQQRFEDEKRQKLEQIQLEEQKKLKDNQEKYALEQWKVYKRNKSKDISYSLVSLFCIVLLSIVNLVNGKTSNCLDISNKPCMNTIWWFVILLLWVIVNIICYLINKEKFREGYRILCVFVTKYKKHKSKKINEFKDNFIKINHSPTP